MKLFTSILGILPVLCMFGGDAFGALRSTGTTRAGRGTDASTSRISVATGTFAAANRSPTIVHTTTAATTAATTTSSATLMSELECIDSYSECIKETDVCGSGFEECTTAELFYTKKPQCNTVLLQCSTAGINRLFGTTKIENITPGSEYPLSGTIIGDYIEASALANMYSDTGTCVKRYTNCLKKETVCGENFELCTSNKEFKNQKIYCESTLARCRDEGKIALFGSTNTDDNPSPESNLGIAIHNGAELAGVNAVDTCYKVIDQCILSACSANPYKCLATSSTLLTQVADAVNTGKVLPENQLGELHDAISKSQVSSFIKNACIDTIGGNKYCHMVFYKPGVTPTERQLRDQDARDDVYDEAYAKRMEENKNLVQKITEAAQVFDTKAKDKCAETIRSCAIRSCGGGLGSACYTQVFGQGRSFSEGNTINGENTYEEIKKGCFGVVNTDVNCQYAAAEVNKNTFGYVYNADGDNSAFATLFPKYESGAANGDPIAVIAKLNGELQTRYSEAAIAELGKRCQTTVKSCVKSMCGSDYTNCYRNRTDVMTDTYSTENKAFNHSMNKVGGVLDFTIVRGLCLDSVKSESTCEEHLKIQSQLTMSSSGSKKKVSGWGTNTTVHDAWTTAVSQGYGKKGTNYGEYKEEIQDGCMIDGTKATTDVCKDKADNVNYVADCGFVDDDGCIYDKANMVSETDYFFGMATNTLFQQVLGDLEKEAQAKYNAKLTQEQHKCMDMNNGGIMGARDLGSTYLWAKLKGKRVPKYYATSGLKTNDFAASNDLYGSFCRVRVTLQSDDPNIQAYLQKGVTWATAYFAVGDAFVCGSWIPQEKLQELAKSVACKKAGYSDQDCERIEEGKLTRGQGWAVAGTAIGGGVLGATVMDLLQTKTGLGGLLNTKPSTDKQDTEGMDNLNLWQKYCKNKVFDSTPECEATTKNGNTCPPKTGTTNEDCEVLCFESTGKFVGTGKRRVALLRPKEYGNTNKDMCGSTITDGSEIVNYVNRVKEAIGESSSTSKWSKGTGRAVIDTIGAATLGTVGAIGVRRALLDKNQRKLTEAEQEFMDTIGEHIFCYVGADAAGTYGTPVEAAYDE